MAPSLDVKELAGHTALECSIMFRQREHRMLVSSLLLRRSRRRGRGVRRRSVFSLVIGMFVFVACGLSNRRLSQGAALMHNAIPALAPEIRDGYTAGVLFGDTKNVQLKGTIGNWPADKLKSFCHKEDGVCWGGLSVNAGHVSYLSSGDLQSAVQWFIEKIDAALANKKEA